MSIKCSSCGKILTPQQRFCTACGAKHENSAIEQILEPASPTRPDVLVKDHSEELDALKFELAEVKRTHQRYKDEAENYRRRYEELGRQFDDTNANGRRLEQQLSETNKELQVLTEELSKSQNEKTEIAFPETLVGTIKEFLGEDGEIDQREIDLIYTEARAFGISDERTKSWLVVESERVKRVQSKKQQVEKKPKKRIWRKLLVFLVVLVILGALMVIAFIFQEVVLDTMDSWGLQTTALRNWLNQINR